MAGLKGIVRTPEVGVRERRNNAIFHSEFDTVMAAPLEVTAEGLISLSYQIPIFADASGLGLNMGNGLELSGSDLTIDLYHPDDPNEPGLSGLEVTSGGIRVLLRTGTDGGITRHVNGLYLNTDNKSLGKSGSGVISVNDGDGLTISLTDLEVDIIADQGLHFVTGQLGIDVTELANTFVPYSGATADVDLATFDLKATEFTVVTAGTDHIINSDGSDNLTLANPNVDDDIILSVNTQTGGQTDVLVIEGLSGVTGQHGGIRIEGGVDINLPRVTSGFGFTVDGISDQATAGGLLEFIVVAEGGTSFVFRQNIDINHADSLAVISTRVIPQWSVIPGAGNTHDVIGVSVVPPTLSASSTGTIILTGFEFDTSGGVLTAGTDYTVYGSKMVRGAISDFASSTLIAYGIKMEGWGAGASVGSMTTEFAIHLDGGKFAIQADGSDTNHCIMLGADTTDAQIYFDGTSLNLDTTEVRIGSAPATNYTQFQSDGSQVFVGTAGLVHGSMYNHDVTTTVTIGATSTPVRIPSGFTVGQLNNTTFGSAREITVGKAGMYLILWSISFETINANQDIEGAIMIDGTPSVQGTAHRRIGTATDIGAMGGVAILDLAASAVISLAVSNETTASNVVVDHASMTVTQVGGT